MAFATRHPDSHYRPLDTLPFIDNAASPSSATLLKRSIADAQLLQARELTAWGTSILAQPLVYEGPWSGTALGLDLCFSLEALRARFSAALATMWPHMPDRSLSHKLVAKYFDEVAWVHAVFHRPTFEAEHARAWEMIEAGRQDEIDPLWLCCYFLVRSASRCGCANGVLLTRDLNRFFRWQSTGFAATSIRSSCHQKSLLGATRRCGTHSHTAWSSSVTGSGALKSASSCASSVPSGS